jgi:signal transduction histidine kinase
MMNGPTSLVSHDLRTASGGAPPPDTEAAVEDGGYPRAARWFVPYRSLASCALAGTFVLLALGAGNGAIQAVGMIACFVTLLDGERRGARLRRELEETVRTLELSRRRAAEAAAAVRRLAASVAHDVNNPLSAIKANVRWLGECRSSPAASSERIEVMADTLDAVDRITHVMGELKRKASEHGDAMTAGARSQLELDRRRSSQQLAG